MIASVLLTAPSNDDFDWFEVDGEGATADEWNFSLNAREDGISWKSE